LVARSDPSRYIASTDVTDLALASTVMGNDPRRGVGEAGERLAELHLARAGYTVLERNFRTGSGELDLIASCPEGIVFCEVRARIGAPGRTPGEPGGALESIGPAKRRRLRRMALEWLSAARPKTAGGRWIGGTIRFDAIGVVVAPDGRLLSLEHVENAF
jgi:putative endonuclease